jgi:PhzF family phenazine biosynthesis protein
MQVTIFQVDAFTAKPFSGNPAAVCILPDLKNEVWMQNMACEMNLSETAFLSKQTNGYDLRWFTPTVEVELCGHATLASAHILWEKDLLRPEQEGRFHTQSGILTAKRAGDKIALNFPANPPIELKHHDTDFAEVLGVRPKYIGKTRFDYLITVASEKEVRDMKPDFARLKQLGLRGVMVTSRSDSQEFDFVSRFFAPGSGIDEDPVTGSAHCSLGPYWSKQLGKQTLNAYQASARGGEMGIRIQGDRVELTGQAVTVMQGKLYKPVTALL